MSGVVPGRRRCPIILGRLRIAELADIDAHDALVVHRIVDVHEPVAVHHFGGLVRRPRMNGLRERLVHAGEQDHELGVPADEVVVRHAEHRALFVDRMDDRPAERKEDDARSLERELIVPARSILRCS